VHTRIVNNLCCNFVDYNESIVLLSSGSMDTTEEILLYRLVNITTNYIINAAVVVGKYWIEYSLFEESVFGYF
jgi:hypothetical protein